MHYIVLAATMDEAKAFQRENHIRNKDFTYCNSPRPLRGQKDTTLIVIQGWQRTKCFLQEATLKAEIAWYGVRNTVIYADGTGYLKDIHDK